MGEGRGAAALVILARGRNQRSSAVGDAIDHRPNTPQRDGTVGVVLGYRFGRVEPGQPGRPGHDRLPRSGQPVGAHLEVVEHPAEPVEQILRGCTLGLQIEDQRGDPCAIACVGLSLIHI